MKLLKFMAGATVALAIGWLIGGVAMLVTIGRYFEQADLDDDIGGLDPRQVADRLRMRNAYINDDTLWPDFND
jgi:hypothetical protein